MVKHSRFTFFSVFVVMALVLTACTGGGDDSSEAPESDAPESEAAASEPAESEAILKLLFAHATRPEFTIRWRWQENDVAFWDNRVTQHYAVDDYRPQRRVMHRATILGDVPF